MVTGEGEWAVLLTETAEKDLRGIVNWTVDQFGTRQAKAYAGTIHEALDALVDGPDIVGVKTRTEIAAKVFTLHAARSGRKARHLIVFRVESRAEKTIQVLRILHDSMDLPRHVTDDNEAED